METTKKVGRLLNKTIAEQRLFVKTTGSVMTGKKQIRTSEDAFEIFQKIWKAEGTILHVESFFLLVLNNTAEPISYALIATGGVNQVIVDPKVIFQNVLAVNGTAFFVAHNHPSGNIMPSKSDDNITAKLHEAGKVMCCTLLDHLILNSKGQYYSYANDDKLL